MIKGNTQVMGGWSVHCRHARIYQLHKTYLPGQSLFYGTCSVTRSFSLFVLGSGCLVRGTFEVVEALVLAGNAFRFPQHKS